MPSPAIRMCGSQGPLAQAETSETYSSLVRTVSRAVGAASGTPESALSTHSTHARSAGAMWRALCSAACLVCVRCGAPGPDRGRVFSAPRSRSGSAGFYTFVKLTAMTPVGTCSRLIVYVVVGQVSRNQSPPFISLLHVVGPADYCDHPGRA
jgi:hypothetical protein